VAQALAAEKEAAPAKVHGKGGAVHWTYSDGTGPEQWGTLSGAFRACDLGVEQSPVNLTRAVPAKMGTMDIAYKSMPLEVVNNGHTIQVNCAPGSHIVLDGTRFRLLQYHFHHPSEHLLNGKAFDMEAHFVHVSDSGTLAVLGVFIEPGAESRALKPVWNVMPSEAGKASGGTVAPADLLPENSAYFRYMGSLTTPPCSQKVIWTVYREPVTASVAQVKKFAEIFPMNARPAQRLNRRLLLRSL